MAVPTVISYFTIKRLLGSRTDDWIDKLNHAYTVTILITFGVVVSTGQFVGDPIHCWAPAEFTDAYVSYAKSYCWIKNTYFIPFPDVLPVDVTYREGEEITYYQWVPLILLFMAFMFKFPNLLWKIFNAHTGLNINQVTDLADRMMGSTKDERKAMTENLVEYMDKWLKAHHSYESNFITRAKARVSRYICFICNKREGKFLTAVYICIKILYVVNVILQFTFLGMFLGMDYNALGYEVIHKLSIGGSWQESPRFPRVTMCDFEIRQLQNIQRYTVQCVLPINLFNEKIFIFLWFWLFLLAVLSAYNFAKWLYLLVLKKNNYTFIKKYLKIVDLIRTDADKKLCRRFANTYLRDDGCFVLRIIATNSTDMVIIDLVKELFEKYKKNLQTVPPTREVHALPEKNMDIPFIDSDTPFVTDTSERNGVSNSSPVLENPLVYN